MKEKEIDELFLELKETHVDDLDLSDPSISIVGQNDCQWNTFK